MTFKVKAFLNWRMVCSFTYKFRNSRYVIKLKQTFLHGRIERGGGSNWKGNGQMNDVLSGEFAGGGSVGHEGYC